MRYLKFPILVAFFLLALHSQESPDAVLQRALHLADLYNWREALPFFEKAQHLFEKSGDKRNALYARIGVIRAARAPIPLQSYKLEQELATNPILQKDDELRLFCLAAKGDLDGEVDPSAMQNDWTEALALARKLGISKWQYRSQGQLGFAAFYAGDLSGAQRNVAAALIEATKANDIGAQIFFLTATAVGLRSQSLNEQAIVYADRAIKLAAASPDTGYPAVAQQTRLLALLGLGRTSAAEAALRELLQRDDMRNSPYQIGRLLSTGSKIAQSRGDTSGAVSYLEQATQRARSVGNDRELAEYQSDLAELHMLSGNLSKAEELARQAADSSQAAGEVALIPRRLHMLAQVQISQKKYADADRTYDRAAAIQDIMIGNADSVLGKTALIQGASLLYAKHFSLLTEQMRDIGKAFSVLERARGRVMTDLLLSGTNSLPSSIATEREVSRLRLKLMTARSDRQIRELRDAIFLAEQSRSVVPEITILRTKDRRLVSLEEVQLSLGPSEVLLEYVLDDPYSYCLVLRRDSSRVARLSGKQTIAPLVTAYLKAVRAKQSSRDSGRRLYDLLLGPVLELGEEQLIIVRDGQLHLLPFDALLDSDGKYIVEGRRVIYSPSATTLFLQRTIRQRREQVAGVLAVGDVPYDRSGLKQQAITRGHTFNELLNLPSSKGEALIATAAFPNPSSILLLGDNATETAAKKAADRTIVHLAVHAIANEARPERSALVLLSDAAHDEDGFLQASEVVQLRLSADLVVLSACDTAVGPVGGQEGISTLSRAFLLAGAKTVVSTLWSIDDNTTLVLMKEFYAQLRNGNDPVAALTTAKRQMLKALGSEALPYYWAGFTVEGLSTPPSPRKN